MNLELEQIRELYNLMLAKGLDALELKEDDAHIRLTRRMAGAVHAPAVQHQAPAAAVEAPEEAPAVPQSAIPSISSPLAGVFYRASAPTSAPYAKEGDMVNPGQTLCIVEAMKVMNEIKAESSCRIVKIVAENGRPVTAGQVLFHIEPA